MADLSRMSDEVRRALQKLATACVIAGGGDDAWDVIVARLVALEAMEARARDSDRLAEFSEPESVSAYILGEWDD